jgi:hypothetical protein
MKIQHSSQPIYLRNSNNPDQTYNQHQFIKNMPIPTFKKVPISLAKQLQKNIIKV